MREHIFKRGDEWTTDVTEYVAREVRAFDMLLTLTGACFPAYRRTVT